MASGYIGTGEEKAIVAALGNNFCIPLGKMFELAQDLPVYQPGLYDGLQFVLHFASYGDMIKYGCAAASGSTAAKPTSWQHCPGVYKGKP